jgi:hypothetical protein
LSSPVEDIASTNFTYSSSNYLPIIYTTIVNVNNDKLTTKTYTKLLHDLNKSIIFAVDKGTFVLLTFKEFILCLNQILILVMVY